MPITVVTSNADGIIHGTDNGKKTGCGIKYNSGDNLRKYKQGEVLTDLIIAMKTLNCEKCRRILSSKMIKEDRKAENKREKEEKKRIAEAIKRGELDADGNPIVKPIEKEVEPNQEVEITKQPPLEAIVETAPIQEPIQPVQLISQTQSNIDIQKEPQLQPTDEGISQYLYEKPTEEPVEVSAKAVPIIDDDLSQFTVNPEELKSSEPEPEKSNKPLTDINDILADLDALMSNMTKKDSTTVKKTAPIIEELPTINEVAPIEETSTVVEELPTIDEVAPIEETSPVVEELPTIDEVAPIEETSPVVEELPTIDEVTPIKETSPVVEELPTIDEVTPIEETSSVVEELPTIDEVTPIEETSPIVEELPTIDEVAPIEETSPIVEELPTIDEVASIEETSAIDEIVPTQEQETISNVPTIQSNAIPNGYINTVQPTQPNILATPTPMSQPTYVQPTPMPQFYYNAYGEAIPITYNEQNQPIFTVPVTYDVQGQPRPVQMNQPTPYIQQNPYMTSQSQPTYVQPTQPVVPKVSTPPPTRVVRADAPPKVSKPVENKPFDFSIFEKEEKKPVFNTGENKIFVDSIEEALSQLGVESDDQKKKEDEVIPEFQEYVAPTKNVKPVTPKKETPKTTPVLSEAERKKREKIDAKLKKEWEKKGLDPNDWKRRKH